MSNHGITYDIAAIETKYRGYKFRSRLEAKWAAFFDLLEWSWEYEPADYEGWIPDFSICGDEGNIILVEVKPIYSLPEELENRFAGIRADGNEILVVGMSFHSAWLFDGNYFAEIEYGRWNKGCGKIGFCHSSNSFVDRISGGYDGGCMGEKPLGRSELNMLWAKACNETRWEK